jgi:hypothetical protein
VIDGDKREQLQPFPHVPSSRQFNGLIEVFAVLSWIGRQTSIEAVEMITQSKELMIKLRQNANVKIVYTTTTNFAGICFAKSYDKETEEKIAFSFT